MQEENRNDLTTAPETREVVDWYVPHRASQQSPREVVDCYVHTDALPGAARPAAEKPPARQKGIGLWIFLGCMAALAVVVAVGVLLNAQSSPVYTPRGSDAIDPNEGNPSSITHMYSDSDTAIPRYDPEGTAAPMRITAEAGEPLSAQAVYAKAAPSTVVVVAGTDKGAYVGTGVIMSEDGYVITNAHVIAEGQECFVATYMGYLYDALLVGADKERDVAVLKMLDAHDLPAAEFGNSENCLVGDTVYAIGNPLGLELMGTMTDGRPPKGETKTCKRTETR